MYEICSVGPKPLLKMAPKKIQRHFISTFLFRQTVEDLEFFYVSLLDNELVSRVHYPKEILPITYLCDVLIR